VELFVPAELEAGVYADRLWGWWSDHHFVVDFAAPLDQERLLATARVRVPVTAVLEMVKDLEALAREYELTYGEIHRPRPRGDE
jgi:hypothetical protein